MKRLPIGLMAAIGFIVSSFVAVAQNFTKFTVPGAGRGHSVGVNSSVIASPPVVVPSPTVITAGPDGALWFTEANANNIGRITTAGDVTEFAIPTVSSQLSGITAGPDGALWFAELAAGKIGRITIDGTITEFVVPTITSNPGNITVGPDGALWFTEGAPLASKIGRITTDGVISEFKVPTFEASPASITFGSDGALWFTEYAMNKIGRITTSGDFTEFTLPTSNSGPDGITAGPDGALWFTAGNSANVIGRITSTGMITEYPIPTAFAGPSAITVGPDGALWFLEPVGNNIGRITTTGHIDEFALPANILSPQSITTGPDGNLWFTAFEAIVTFAPPPPTSPLFAATLPSSRSVQVGGEVATAFASVINSGTSAMNCGIAPVTPVPANFIFQATDPATNQLIGTPNTRVPIAAGATQSYLIAFTPNAPFVSTNVTVGYDCDNVEAVATIVGVNTLLLTFSAVPVPDMITVGVTHSNDGYAHTGGTSGTGLFATAATNIGASGQLTARVRLSDAALPLTVTICQTDPSTGQCLAPPSATVTTTIAANQNTTWTAFLKASGAVAQDPAKNRVYFEFVDSSGVVRGSTSTAVTTQ
jgi:virginiamycin B lyase